MKVTVIPLVIGALGTIPKGLVRGLGELEIGALLMLYQAYSCEERTKRRVVNQTRRQVKNLTIVLTNKNKKFKQFC